MLDLKYSLVIEATDDPTFFGFYSPDLEGFAGIGHSVENCLYQAKWAMAEHVAILRQKRLRVPKLNPRPVILSQNENRSRRRRKAHAKLVQD
ncbi:type II toxin-antitoxin system HicB family antitoxin [candidate division KSB1 bacterium]|nr:type II toxin-antitoxin system HicB family antitoxin [bacterium]NUM65495.1 type II toxin-antitoxin system HicB family antitoxin [candidate division KSB1 bacterium]